MTDRMEGSDAVGGRERGWPAEAPRDALREVQRESGGIGIQCQYCMGRKFRRSRLRRMDVKHLLLLRYPVRCLRCSQRQMVSFSVAGVSISSHAKHIPERHAGAGRNASGQ